MSSYFRNSPKKIYSVFNESNVKIPWKKKIRKKQFKSKLRSVNSVEDNSVARQCMNNGKRPIICDWIWAAGIGDTTFGYCIRLSEAYTPKAQHLIANRVKCATKAIIMRLWQRNARVRCCSVVFCFEMCWECFDCCLHRNSHINHVMKQPWNGIDESEWRKKMNGQ